jgi:CDP-glycerol glycerophosphotransferase
MELDNSFGDSAVDASDYHDMQELMAASEILISDYSSCLFDFMLTRRPAFIFATDLAEYENDRGFYYSPRTTPFPIAESNEELARAISGFDLDRYREAVAEFLAEKGCREDGQASRRVVDLLQSLI